MPSSPKKDFVHTKFVDPDCRFWQISFDVLLVNVSSEILRASGQYCGLLLPQKESGPLTAVSPIRSCNAHIYTKPTEERRDCSKKLVCPIVDLPLSRSSFSYQMGRAFEHEIPYQCGRHLFVGVLGSLAKDQQHEVHGWKSDG